MAEEKNKGMTTLDIIRGISQAASNAWDGYDDKGERIKVGLKREKGDPILDKRVIDGFGIKFHGNKLCINYHGEVNMKDIHKRGPARFEEEIEQMFGDIAKFLKKEYKKTTGAGLTLTPEKETDSLIQRMNSKRNWVQSVKWYTIGKTPDITAVDDVDATSDPHIKNVDDAVRNFLKLGKNDKAY